jgi:hypothetical protein
MRRLLFNVWFFLLFSDLALGQGLSVKLAEGMVIERSCRVETARYVFMSPPADFISIGERRSFQPAIHIKGKGIVVDFQGAVIDRLAGAPDLFSGLGVLVEGEDIVIKNLVIRGFKVGILADGVRGLEVLSCDVSYNYRARLYSGREREDYTDWLSYHQNEMDEWLRYGSGIYLRSCFQFKVAGCKGIYGQNALLMRDSHGGLVFNNVFQFNSGLGIGLYRSTHNRLMHNRLDFNIRRHSPGFYSRGQDSAGILLFEQSSSNLIAFNSATHCGYGFLLWAGQSTMDTGLGGCNDNYIFGNDFSFASVNGVEATFSRNRIQGNILVGCENGIWGGYSYSSMINGNYIKDCRTGIAIEQGQSDTIRQNYFEGDSIGVQLCSRMKQSHDYGYFRERDIRSMHHVLDRNVFTGVRLPLRVTGSLGIQVNGENLFYDFERLVATDTTNEGFKFLRNDIYTSADRLDWLWSFELPESQRNLNFNHPNQRPDDVYSPLMVPYIQLEEPDSLEGGMNTALEMQYPKGRDKILMDAWGPYNYKRPFINLRSVKRLDNGVLMYQFRLMGPGGRYAIIDHTGFSAGLKMAGMFPDLLVLERDTTVIFPALVIQFVPDRDFVDGFGRVIVAGSPYRLIYEGELPGFLNWETRFYEPMEAIVSIADFRHLSGLVPAGKSWQRGLSFFWPGRPLEGLRQDGFATISVAEAEIGEGWYRITLSSNNCGVVYVDGREVLSLCDPGEKAASSIEVKLGGHHRFEVKHYDAGGFSSLSCYLSRIIKEDN